jgi:hypothetical protein
MTYVQHTAMVRSSSRSRTRIERGNSSSASRLASLCPRPYVITSAVLLVASSCATSPFRSGNGFDTTVMANFGWRCADSDLEPVDQQRALGLEADVRLPNDQTGLEIGLFHSDRDGERDVSGVGDVDVHASMTEASVGGRWRYGATWILGAEPYASAGASLIWLSSKSDGARGTSQSATDWTIGPYIRFGLQWTFAEHLVLALDYRQVLFTDWFHDVQLDDVSTDANYSQVGVVLGWQF